MYTFKRVVVFIILKFRSSRNVVVDEGGITTCRSGKLFCSQSSQFRRRDDRNHFIFTAAASPFSAAWGHTAVDGHNT